MTTKCSFCTSRGGSMSFRDRTNSRLAWCSIPTPQNEKETRAAPVRAARLHLMDTDDRRRWETWAVLLAAVVMIPLGTAWATAASARSRMADCRDNLRQLGAAFSAYNARFGSYPEPGTVS